MKTTVHLSLKVAGLIPSIALNLGIVSAGTGLAIYGAKNLANIISQIVKVKVELQ